MEEGKSSLSKITILVSHSDLNYRWRIYRFALLEIAVNEDTLEGNKPGNTYLSPSHQQPAHDQVADER